MNRWVDRFSLQGKTALVTGASKGIGAEICAVFADAGADIIATGRDTDGLEKVAAVVRGLGKQCQVFPCDLKDTGAIEQMVKATTENTTVDILVNNAGVALVGPADSFSLQQWDDTMAINLRAPFLLSQLLVPGMIKQQWGKIINISSQAGVIAFENHAAYSASKAGLNALTRGMMIEWARHNIQVNAICPTVILTDMGQEIWGPKEKSQPMIDKTPLGRFGEPVEVADMALYLASPASGLVNGETLLIDGGYSAA